MLLKSSLLLLVFSIVTVAAAKAQDFVSSVRASLEHGSVAEAEAKLKSYRDARGTTPEYLEAYSWLGRNALAAKHYPQAEKLAEQAHAMVVTELKKRAVDAEAHLPMALGASIEVKAQAMSAEGERNEAVAYLRGELKKYEATSVAPRIQKNINLLSLEGKVAPALHEGDYLGLKPQPLSSLKGKPVLLFFWAHWCPDCKFEAPVLGKLRAEFGDRFIVIGPTQLYGAIGEGTPASPADELRYIDGVRAKYYGLIPDMAVPVSSEDFQRYGVSTTPTLVLVGGDGVVKMYHPGRMTYEELKAKLVSVLPRQ